MIEVHLPVSRDEWLTVAHVTPLLKKIFEINKKGLEIDQAPTNYESSTSMPGNFLPSRYSSEAPPPVEM
jgi:hypothetical protein